MLRGVLSNAPCDEYTADLFGLFAFLRILSVADVVGHRGGSKGALSGQPLTAALLVEGRVSPPAKSRSCDIVSVAPVLFFFVL